jgi:hypothetical protein
MSILIEGLSAIRFGVVQGKKIARDRWVLCRRQRGKAAGTAACLSESS